MLAASVVDILENADTSLKSQLNEDIDVNSCRLNSDIFFSSFLYFIHRIIHER